ncbi:Pyruvate phosphate dikinase PEP/pyruvate-binding [uncultured Desulfobacterium sp.]|uniref:Phosphoenolpyruvate synthase n=1 Tax=uncultured Desulfobacterium sp. TaxID=201089 RepID=A0A445N1R0_9BACT|nr:Pyruvate phosphate dikinase PEP/pyruvate-binding [uncultured Desulfobacterium sp.]
MTYYSHVSTGWQSLDGIIDHLRKGDNVVWQVDSIDDYQRLVTLFVNSAVSSNQKLVYMRFARHMPLMEERRNITIYHLNVANGFESFSSEVHSIITKEGRDIFYVFDCLSDLLHVWATDLMIGNFFFITCPYLFELNTIAYFAILRNRHSFKAIARIRETTQLLIDVYNYRGQVCVHPLKVQNRYSPTMFFPHIKEKDQLVPVINSGEATRLFSHLSRNNSVDAQRHLDYWDRLFMQAGEILESDASAEEKTDMVEQLSRILLSRNRRTLDLIRSNFTLEDLLQLKERLIGTGFIGGKSLGMLLSRKVLMLDKFNNWREVLEHHDSFYIGSDVFYSYIVQNGWWKLFMAHKTKEGYFSKAGELKNNMLKGVFPEEIKEQFQLMLEYFGQSPIIVRSSSLLEDAVGSAFAGKYDSFFCVNQGPPEKRYEAFEEAVKRIFASTMNEDALAYRLQRGLDQMDEQMALLVQRVSGSYHKNYFFPELAGVGLSRNPFVWKKDMDPNAGMLRLVFGMGTRAVDRVGNDYPRIVAISDPLIKPLSEMKDIKRFSQHFVDLLNLEENRLQTMSISQMTEAGLAARLEMIGIRDTEAAEYVRSLGKPSVELWILTFDRFLTETTFTDVMGRMLKTLEDRLGIPVDIEYTVNFNQSGQIQVNLLQCRPFQNLSKSVSMSLPDDVPEERIIIRTEGNFMGGNVFIPVSRIIFVDPKEYTKLSLSEKYSVARLIGKLNRLTADRNLVSTLLMGPGRWGTRTPAMGVPVTFSEINHIAAIAEISFQDENLIPDLSFGTHFFHDLVENSIFYLAIYPENPGIIFNSGWIGDLPNMLDQISPSDNVFGHIVKVADVTDKALKIFSNVVTQKTICYLAG